VLAAEAFGAGTAHTIEIARPLWDAGRSAGLVSGSIDAVREELFFSQDAARALSGAEALSLIEKLRRASAPRIVFEELVFFEGFLEAFSKLFETARIGDWLPARFSDAVTVLANKFVSGPVAKAFVETAIVVPFFDSGAREALKRPDLGRLFPYLEQLTRKNLDLAEPPFEIRVRDNHLALHEFTAAADSSVWVAECAPPLGWVCRCRDRRVSFVEAEERNLIGEFPLGTDKLDRFRQLGGADAGFPRERFVIP
jgi:hypothetical protein